MLTVRMSEKKNSTRRDLPDSEIDTVTRGNTR